MGQNGHVRRSAKGGKRTFGTAAPNVRYARSLGRLARRAQLPKAAVRSPARDSVHWGHNRLAASGVSYGRSERPEVGG